MRAESETRGRGFGGAIFSIVMIALMCYLTFAALQGEYGLFRLFQIEGQEHRLQAELDGLRLERAEIKNLTLRLSSATLDLDLLDERARRVLGLARPDEIMIR
jgi:cell division protein FtsB